MAVDLSREKMNQNAGGPFGCVIVKGGQVIAQGWNAVTSENDPTCHAEMMAIRKACKNLKTFDLSGCEVYTSCYPCPMCLGALYWARVDQVFYANSAQEASDIGFDDAFIYEQMLLPEKERSIPFTPISDPQAREVFKEWAEKEDKQTY